MNLSGSSAVGGQNGLPKQTFVKDGGEFSAKDKLLRTLKSGTDPSFKELKTDVKTYFNNKAAEFVNKKGFEFIELFKVAKPLDGTKQKFWRKITTEKCKDKKDSTFTKFLDDAITQIGGQIDHFIKECKDNGIENVGKAWKNEVEASIRRALETIREIILHPENVKKEDLSNLLADFPKSPVHFKIVHTALLKGMFGLLLSIGECIDETAKIKYGIGKEEINPSIQETITGRLVKKMEFNFRMLHRNFGEVLHETGKNIKIIMKTGTPIKQEGEKKLPDPPREPGKAPTRKTIPEPEKAKPPEKPPVPPTWPTIKLGKGPDIYRKPGKLRNDPLGKVPGLLKLNKITKYIGPHRIEVMDLPTEPTKKKLEYELSFAFFLLLRSSPYQKNRRTSLLS